MWDGNGRWESRGVVRKALWMAQSVHDQHAKAATAVEALQYALCIHIRVDAATATTCRKRGNCESHSSEAAKHMDTPRSGLLQSRIRVAPSRGPSVRSATHVKRRVGLDRERMFRCLAA